MNGTKIAWKWRTPFLDIFYYTDNNTHILGDGFHQYLKSHVFPLTSRPYLGQLLPAPRDPRSILARKFGDGLVLPPGDLCKGVSRNYIKDKFIHYHTPLVNCSQLTNHYPFVRHVRGEGGAYCQEQLVMRGRVLSVFYRDAAGIPFC